MSETLFYSLEGPLDSLPVDRQMRTANFNGFTDLVRSRGADPRRILERYGIDPRAIHNPDSYIDCKSLVDVLQHCSTSFNDPLFGLHLAQFQDPDVYGCIAALCRAASTVREAIGGFVDYMPVIHAPVVMLELVEGEELAELRWAERTNLGMNDQANYQATLLNLKLLHLIGGRNFQPRYVNLAVDARPKDIGQIEDQFGCKLNTHTSSNAIAFPVEVLNQSVATANRLLFKLLSGYLDRVKAASRTTVVERVEDYVRGALSLGNCSIERCAKRLGTSVRTLQANLSESGLRFSDILEQQRIELAKVHLQEGRLSLDEIALLLGYSEQSSFGRAFKRWTGMTPQRYRRNLDVVTAA